MRHRVITSQHGGWVDPSACFMALYGSSEPVFWLDSGADANAGMSCMGLGSLVVTETHGSLHGIPTESLAHENILDFLRSEQTPGVLCDDSGAKFPLGWVGWLGYELHNATLHSGSRRQSRFPDAAFLFAERAIVFDHAARTVTFVALGEAWSGELADWRDESSRKLAALDHGEPPIVEALDEVESRECPEAAESQQHPVWAHTDAEYLAMIDECQRSIGAGDAYLLCLTTHVTLDVHPDPASTYLRLRELSPSHHGGFIRMAGVSLLSSSPEKFLTVSATGAIESKPIKGTRKRGSMPEEDAAFRSELLSSVKERAENLMIVDVVRNDLTRVCEVGSVTVPALLEVESYAQVHQLVSTVRGTLAPGFDAVDAVEACFPAGSMTGAPKLRAVQLLDALEGGPRGIYSGAWGYFGLDGSVDLAMTIRSIVMDEYGVSMGTGGGITALSVPSEELEETRIKTAALLRALGLITL